MVKSYFIDDSRGERQRRNFLIRDEVVFLNRGILANGGYTHVQLYKQAFKLLKILRDNGAWLTNAEMVLILRRELRLKDMPTQYELTRLRHIMCEFRRWLGPTAGIIAYVHKAEVQHGRFKFVQSIFKPIKLKREYMQIAGRHIENITDALNTRHTANKALLAMKQREIDKIIEEADKRLDIEIEMGADKKRKKGGNSKRGNRSNKK